MSFKKPDKKSKKLLDIFGREREGDKKHSISSLAGGGGGGGGGGGTERYKTRLLELLALVEHEFDQLHAENTACELLVCFMRC